MDHRKELSGKEVRRVKDLSHHHKSTKDTNASGKKWFALSLWQRGDLAEVVFAEFVVDAARGNAQLLSYFGSISVRAFEC